MSDDADLSPHDELLRDRRHEGWLLVKGLISLLIVVTVVVVRHLYLQ